MQTRVHCCMAGTLVTLTSLPPKLNPIIRPLMDCIKTESDTLMQVERKEGGRGGGGKDKEIGRRREWETKEKEREGGYVERGGL